MFKNKPTCNKNVGIISAAITPTRQSSGHQPNSVEAHLIIDFEKIRCTSAEVELVDHSCYEIILGEDDPNILGDGNREETVEGVVEELSSIWTEVRRLRMSLEPYLICASNEPSLEMKRAGRSEERKLSREVVTLFDGFAVMGCAKRRRRM